MIITLSSTVSLQAHYIQQRGKVYWFVLRVPADLVDRYGRPLIRETLKTTDAPTALKAAKARYDEWQLRFKTWRGNETLTPTEVVRSAQSLVDEWKDFDWFAEHYAEPRFHAYLRKHGILDLDDADRVEHRDYRTRRHTRCRLPVRRSEADQMSVRQRETHEDVRR